MPQDATCPGCTHIFPVTEARQPFTVPCPKCEVDITIEFKKPSKAPEAGEPPFDLLVKKGALPDAGAPTAPAKRKLDEEDDPKRKGGSAMIVFLSGGFGLLFVLGGLSLTSWYLFTQIDYDTPSNNSWAGNRPNNTSPGNKQNNTGGGNNSGGGGNNTGGGGNNGGGNQPPPKPKDTFALDPKLVAVSKIEPPSDLDASAPRTILLPGKVGTASIGGGGRYIVLHFPEQSRLAVFDVNTGYMLSDGVPTDRGNVLLAAGANKVVTIPRDGKKFTVYSLPDLNAMNSFDLPTFFGVKAIGMGSRTNGPLVVTAGFTNVLAMDVGSGKVIEGSSVEMNMASNMVRASADGKLFLTGNGYGSNDKFELLDESSKKWRNRKPELTAGYIAADGKHLYGMNQIMTNTGSEVAGKPASVTGNVWYVPAVTATGNYFLRVNEVKVPDGKRTKNGVSVAIHRNNRVDAPVLTAWEGLTETEGLIHNGGHGTEHLDKHLFLIPEAKMLVILNRDKSKLVVRKLLI